MVRKFLALGSLLVLVSCSGIGWGKKAPPPQQIADKVAESSCPDAGKIVTANEADSQGTLECWIGESTKLWTQVQGAVPGRLSESEIDALIRRGIVKVPAGYAETVAKIHAAFELLGIQGALTRERYDAWIAWARAERSALRVAYAQLVAGSETKSVTGMRGALEAVASFIAESGWDRGFTYAKARADLMVLADADDQRLSRLDAATRFLSLTGRSDGSEAVGFAQILSDRIQWARPRLNDLLYFHNYWSKSPDERQAAIARLREEGQAYFTDLDVARVTPLIRSFLDEVRWPADWGFGGGSAGLVADLQSLFQLRDSDLAVLTALTRILGVDGAGFSRKFTLRSDWILAHWAQADFSALDLFRAHPIFRADLATAAGILDSFLSQADYPASRNASAIEADLRTIGALSPDDLPKFRSVVDLLGLNSGSFVPRARNALAWIQAHARELSAAMLEVNAKGMGDGKTLADSAGVFAKYLAAVPLGPEFDARALERDLSVWIQFSPTDLDALRAAEDIAGVANGPGFQTKAEKALAWASIHWSESKTLIDRVGAAVAGSRRVDSKDIVAFAHQLSAFLATDILPENYDTDALDADLLRLKVVSAADLSRLHGIFALSGLRGAAGPMPIKGRLRSLSAWVEQNWLEAASLLDLRNPTITARYVFRYSDVEKATRLAASFLAPAGVSLSSTDLASALQAAFGFSDPIVSGSLPKITAFGLNFMASICPEISDDTVFRSEEFSHCLPAWSRLGAPGKDFLEYALNPIEAPLSAAALARVLGSEAELIRAWRVWFETNRARLHALSTELIEELADSWGAKPPANFLDALDIVRRIDPSSNGRAFQAPVYEAFAAAADDFLKLWLTGNQIFAAAVAEKRCANPGARLWSDCVLPESARQHPADPALALALQVRNLHYGAEVAPFDGKAFRSIMIDSALARVILHAFDREGRGLITADARDPNNEVAELIGTSFSSLDTIARFATNVARKLQGLAVIETGPRFSLANYDMVGLSRLVTLYATDLLVTRTPEERRSLSKLLADVLAIVTNISPESAIYLDQKGITATLVALDTMGGFEDDYVAQIRRDFPPAPGSDEGLIPRDQVVWEIDRILERDFPRTFRSCREFGFEGACRVVFDNILPADADGVKGVTKVSDLDVITIVAEGMEGLLDNCDYNHDELLQLDISNGNDELACATTLFVNAAQRLLASKIVHSDASGKISSLLAFLNNNDITRIFGKVPLIDGTTRYMAFAPFELPVIIFENIISKRNRRASLGSMYSLLADMIDQDRARNPRPLPHPQSR